MSTRRIGSILAVLAALTLLLIVPGPAAGAAAPEAATGSTYRVEGVATPQARTALARTGAAIDLVEAGSVVVTATPAEVARIRRLGYELTGLAGRGGVTAQNFPAADAGYHNYTELANEVAAVAAANPALVQRFSLGRSHQGRDVWPPRSATTWRATRTSPRCCSRAASTPASTSASRCASTCSTS